jgi:hypothetical protein
VCTRPGFRVLISLLGSHGLSSLLLKDGLLPDKKSFEPPPFWLAPRQSGREGRNP